MNRGSRQTGAGFRPPAAGATGKKNSIPVYVPGASPRQVIPSFRRTSRRQQERKCEATADTAAMAPVSHATTNRFVITLYVKPIMNTPFMMTMATIEMLWLAPASANSGPRR